MSLDLDSLQSDAVALIEAAGDLKSLETARVELFGKSGRLTTALKAIGQLPKDEKPAAGQAVNQVKKALQAVLDSRRVMLESQALAEKLASDAIDVTLPGRGVRPGGLHPR